MQDNILIPVQRIVQILDSYKCLDGTVLTDDDLSTETLKVKNNRNGRSELLASSNNEPNGYPVDLGSMNQTALISFGGKKRILGQVLSLATEPIKTIKPEDLGNVETVFKESNISLTKKGFFAFITKLTQLVKEKAQVQVLLNGAKMTLEDYIKNKLMNIIVNKITDSEVAYEILRRLDEESLELNNNDIIFTKENLRIIALKAYNFNTEEAKATIDKLNSANDEGEIISNLKKLMQSCDFYSSPELIIRLWLKFNIFQDDSKTYNYLQQVKKNRDVLRSLTTEP